MSEKQAPELAILEVKSEYQNDEELDKRLGAVLTKFSVLNSALNTVIACLNEGFSSLHVKIEGISSEVASLSDRLSSLESKVGSIDISISSNDMQLNDRISHLRSEVVSIRDDVSSSRGAAAIMADSINSYGRPPPALQPSPRVTQTRTTPAQAGPLQVPPTTAVTSRATTGGSRAPSRTSSMSSQSDGYDTHSAATSSMSTPGFYGGSGKYILSPPAAKSIDVDEFRADNNTPWVSGAANFKSVDECVSFYSSRTPYIKGSVHGIMYCIARHINTGQRMEVNLDAPMFKVLNNYIAMATAAIGLDYTVKKSDENLFKSDMLLFDYNKLCSDNRYISVTKDIDHRTLARAIRSVTSLSTVVASIVELIFTYFAHCATNWSQLNFEMGFDPLCDITRRIGILLAYLPGMGAIDRSSINMVDVALTQDDVRILTTISMGSHMLVPDKNTEQQVVRVMKELASSGVSYR